MKLGLANVRRVGKWSGPRRAAEKAAEPSPGEVRASIARKVEKLRQQVLADRTRKADEWRRLSPEAREAYRTWMTLRARDLGEDEGADTALPEWALSEEDLATGRAEAVEQEVLPSGLENRATAGGLVEDGGDGARVGVPVSNDWRDFQERE